jgi:hypothetical protein
VGGDHLDRKQARYDTGDLARVGPPRRGGTPGEAKSVILYQRIKAAAQPTVWDATKNGWRKLGTLRANRFGVYRGGRTRRHGM